MDKYRRTPHEADAAAARAMAHMIEKQWPIGEQETLGDDRLPSAMTLHHAWAIAAITQPGSPPVFGQFVTCNPGQRCPDCTIACSTEALASDINRTASRDVIIVSAGGSFEDPAWLAVEVLVAGRPKNSGVGIPYCDEDGALHFAVPAVGLQLTPHRFGVRVNPLSMPSPVLAHNALVFREMFLEVRREILRLDAVRQSLAKAS